MFLVLYLDILMMIHYNQDLKQLARNLRKQGTLSEMVLWRHLRAYKMRGYQFMRQKPLGRYIVDFLCAQLLLIIEIDGESHADKEQHDTGRQKNLEAQGFTVLRFDDRAVKARTSSVVEAIHHWIEEWEKQQPPHSPFSKGDEERKPPPHSPFSERDEER